MRILNNLIDNKTTFNTILVLFVLNICQSQTVINLEEQDLRKTPIDSINFDDIRLSEILNKASEDLFMLNKLIESHADTTKVQDLNERRKERIDTYVSFTEGKLTQDLSNFSNRELENVDRQWSNQKDEIESIIGDYLVLIDRLEGEKKVYRNNCRVLGKV